MRERHSHLILLAAAPLAVAVGAIVACNPKAPATTAGKPAAAATAAAASGKTRAMTLAETGIDSSALDKTADPCTDFYQYACGGWMKTFEIPADKSRFTKSFNSIDDHNEEVLKKILEDASNAPAGADPLVKKVGDYYFACMDEKTIDATGAAPLRPMRDEIAKVKDIKSLEKTLAKMHRAQSWAFFNVGSQQDFKDATKVILGVDQGGLGLPDRDYYLKDDERTKSIREFYTGHVERMFGLLGEKPAKAKAAAADVMRIETKLAELSQSRVERREPSNVYHKIDFAGLSATAKNFPWKTYFDDIKHPGLNDISVNSTKYFEGMDALMKSEKPEAIRNYLTWQVAHHYAMLLSKPFVEEAFSMRAKLSGAKEIEPRWKRCVRSVDASLGELLAQPYVKQEFPGESKPVAENLVKGIASAMRTDVKGLDWMDDATKNAAYQKVDKMAFQIGYPEKWRSYEFAVKRDAYAANAMAGAASGFDYDLDYVGKPIDRSRWGMTPPTVNAYYDPSMNQMVFPAGILQPPFFSMNRLSAVNYGAIGSVMGHELTHGFDDEGAQFDADGNLKNWWSAGTGDKFKEKTSCVAKQYGGYEPLPGQKLNGELTTGENIADIGGLKLAWTAWKAARAKEGGDPVVAEGLTEDQIFFVSFAQGWCEKMRPEEQAMRIKTDPHSPGHFRVIGTVADTPPFAEAFHCKAAPVCQVW